MAVYPELTRRNMRYMGSIESIKYNNSFNEKKINIEKNKKYYEDNIKPLLDEIDQEVNKRETLKERLYSLQNTVKYIQEEREGI